MGGGSVMQVTNKVTGLAYLIGNEVVAVGDGAKILIPTPVTSDEVTFPYYCNSIVIGIPYQTTISTYQPRHVVAGVHNSRDAAEVEPRHAFSVRVDGRAGWN